MIGKNSTIAGGVFLVHSVPADSVVTLEERQIKIMKKKDAKGVGPDFQI